MTVMFNAPLFPRRERGGVGGGAGGVCGWGWEEQAVATRCTHHSLDCGVSIASEIKIKGNEYRKPNRTKHAIIRIFQFFFPPLSLILLPSILTHKKKTGRAPLGRDVSSHAHENKNETTSAGLLPDAGLAVEGVRGRRGGSCSEGVEGKASGGGGGRALGTRSPLHTHTHAHTHTPTPTHTHAHTHTHTHTHMYIGSSVSCGEAAEPSSKVSSNLITASEAVCHIRAEALRPLAHTHSHTHIHTHTSGSEAIARPVLRAEALRPLAKGLLPRSAPIRASSLLPPRPISAAGYMHL